MAYRKRLKYTEEMKSYIWDRYQQGDAVKSIGRYFDRPTSSIHRQLAVTGGIRPPRRKRSTRCLSLAEREEVSRGLVVGLSIRAIASGLGRAPSTVSRQIMRNGGEKRSGRIYYSRFRTVERKNQAISSLKIDLSQVFQVFL